MSRLSQASALLIYQRAMQARGFSPETIAGNLADARRALAWVARPPRRLRRRHVLEYLAHLQRAGVSPATQVRRLLVLRKLAQALRSEGLLAQDPTQGLRVEKPVPGPRLFPSRAAVEALLRAADRPRRFARPAIQLRDRALLELLYGLGLRSREVRAAQVQDLDLVEGALHVRPAKRGPPRTLPLPRAALPHLRRYLEQGRPLLVRGRLDTGHLIVSKSGRPLTLTGGRSVVNAVVAKLARRAGARCHPHALRRGLATHLVENGVSVRAVQVLLGHASLQATQRYLGVDRDALRRTVELLERGRGQGPRPHGSA